MCPNSKARRFVEQHKVTGPKNMTAGQEYYWLTGKFKNAEPEATDTDEYWLERGYATIVPCTTDNSVLNILPELSSVLGI